MTLAIRTPQTTSTPLGAQAISDEVLLEKYAKGDERSVDDVHRRVARALAQAEAPEQRAHWEARFAAGAAARLHARPGASSRPPAPALRPR